MDDPVVTNSTAETAARPFAVVVPSESASADEIALAITRDIFGRAATIEVECDPSYCEYQWRVVTVTCQSSTDELLSREEHWHQRMRQSLGVAAARYSLCVYPE